MAKQKLIYTILLFMMPILLCAQNKEDKGKKDNAIIGELYDSFTKIPLKGKVYLLSKDSMVIDSAKTQIYRKNCNFYFRIPKEEKDYIILAKIPGYEDYYRNLHFKPKARKPYWNIDTFWMKKKNKDYHAELDEVVVKATRVQMYYKGDTIVYDASAFVLPEGSMLDALIRQMPGAKLDENGNITINGKHVDYLTLNGKDFFRGKNKIMLENLPYYSVKDIKVYDKEKYEIEKIASNDGKQTDYVMDVNLKREYQRSYLGNAEVGYGTEDRWMARFFGLYTGDLSNITVFANANNISEDRKPGQDGSWKPSSMKKSIKTTKQVGLNIQSDTRNKKWLNTFDTTVEWSEDKMESKSLSETYASDGNILKGSERYNLDKDFKFELSNRLYNKKKGSAFLSLRYQNNKSWSNGKDSTYRDALVNMSDNLGFSKQKQLHAFLNLQRRWELSSGDHLSVFLSGNYTSTKPDDTYRINKTHFAQTAKDDVRNQYTNRQLHLYSYTTELSYGMQFSQKVRVSPYINYTQRYTANQNSNYRLDWLEDGKYDDLGILPSNDADFARAFDPNNSSDYNILTRNYSAGLNISILFKDNSNLYFKIPDLHIEKERMNYTKSILDTIASRKRTYFEPYITWQKWGKNKFMVRYYVYNLQPAFASLMPYTSDNNPLAIYTNNPNQKSMTEHRFNLEKNWKSDSTDLNRWINIEAKLIQNAFGTRTNYNTKTGAFRYMNDNVNGNWEARIKAGFSRSLDKKRRWNLDVDGSVKYTHSVDFDIAYNEEVSALSHVNTWNPALNFALKYRLPSFTIGIIGKSFARFSRGDRENFENINACDFQYGGNLTYTIPMVKLTIATDINMFSRRGYNSSMMNTNDLVWNAQLTHPLFKGMVIAKMQVFDILHQLSNKSFHVDAQGRTETWYNTIPRYMMFSLAFKMHKKNKK